MDWRLNDRIVACIGLKKKKLKRKLVMTPPSKKAKHLHIIRPSSPSSPSLTFIYNV